MGNVVHSLLKMFNFQLNLRAVTMQINCLICPQQQRGVMGVVVQIGGIREMRSRQRGIVDVVVQWLFDKP